MNSFGIDFGGATTVVCLRDGTGSRARNRLVGDGFRAAIPHAVRAPSAQTQEWGTRALESPDVLRPIGNDGLWLDKPGAPSFWRGLMNRLTTYVGRVKPSVRNGYEVVVAVQSLDLESAVRDVGALCRDAGFEDALVVPGAHALLCRWMSEAMLTGRGEGEQTVACVSVGDENVSVCAYRVTMRGVRVPLVESSSRCSLVSGCGGNAWTARLLREVAARWREEPEQKHELALRDAATEFGARLSRSRADECVEWDGPLAERMFETLRLSREECREWPEVQALSHVLPDLLRAATASVSSRERVDVVIVGGAGAMWPFAADCASSFGPVWKSGFPLEDVARGAACWPEVGHPNAEMLALDGSPSGVFGELSSSPLDFETHITPSQPLTESIAASESFEMPSEDFHSGHSFDWTAPENNFPIEDEPPDEEAEEAPPSQRWKTE